MTAPSAQSQSSGNARDVSPPSQPRYRGSGQPDGTEDAPSSTHESSTDKPSSSTETSATKSQRHLDPKWDHSGRYEFGGPLGVSMIMTGFPIIMYYMWIGATYYDGHLPRPSADQTIPDFLRHLGNLIYTGAFPSLRAWTIYWSFFIFEIALYLFAPGITIKGRPLEHLGGARLTYYCSALSSFYITLIAAISLHVLGIFRLYTIIDEFGPLMSVACITGVLMSFAFYLSAKVRHTEHRITGNPIYDFFMGMELNPRIFGILDFKMFFEVRIPWYMLLLTTMGAAARQYENHGYVPGEVAFLVIAHFLYANACSKGEELITPTWDMYYEKLGFMLTFWNLAGVPLSYCHCSIYLANHDPSTYKWQKPFLAIFFTAYLFVYWVWDTTNSQKNWFRTQMRSDGVSQRRFFRLPWQTLENPKTITSKKGDVLLCDGWYGYARKIHYTCDLFFALSWGLITGFDSPFPWFYPVFFTGMILHRASRNITRCRAHYGEAWAEYERRVPYLFIPYVY